jgi:DNA polymerase V
MIMHVDGNSFYASCERLFRPDLYGKPIAVLSNNDGIIVALSQECKDAGFKRGDVYFKVRERLESAGAAVFSSNYALYADLSARLNALYGSFAHDVEVYSIDESFLYFPDWDGGGYSDIARELRKRAAREVGLPVSCGIAPTKTLAKLCNKLAKKTGGVFEWSLCDKEKTLAGYPVQDVWGIGRAKTAFLNAQGVFTALDLKYYPLDKAKKHLSVTGFRTVRELNEISEIDRTERGAHQNIMCSRSFSAPVFYLDEIATALSEFAQEAVKRLREDKLKCGIVTVFLMTNPYSEGKQYHNSASARLCRASSYLPDILSAALGLARQIYRRGYKYRKVLVGLWGLEADESPQYELFFDEARDVRKTRVMGSFDRINERYGRGTICLGASFAARKAADVDFSPWEMKRELLSPSYTTSFYDLPKVL